MDYQLLQLAAVYAEDARVPRTAGPRRPSRSALSSFGSWIRRTIQRRRGYQRLQQTEDLTYLWLEDGPEEEPDRTIFEPPEDLLAPGDALQLWHLTPDPPGAAGGLPDQPGRHPGAYPAALRVVRGVHSAAGPSHGRARPVRASGSPHPGPDWRLLVASGLMASFYS